MGGTGIRGTSRLVATALSLVLLVAVAGCGSSKGDASTSSSSTTSTTAASTTTSPPRTSTTQTTASGTPNPIVTAPSTFHGAHLVGQWYSHGTGFTVQPDGRFSLTYRTYNDCADSPPPCDRTEGDQIISGGSVNGSFDHGASPEWTGTIATAADTTAWPIGPIDARYQAATDTLVLQAGPAGSDGEGALTLCGPSAPPGTCGA